MRSTEPAVPRRAVVLAAGVGGRLGYHTAALPKPLVPVGGRAIIAYTLEALADAGCEEAIVVTGYRERQLRAALGDGAPLAIRFVSNPRFERGASYSWRAARPFCGQEPFFLVMSDHLLSAGLLRRLALSSPADACRVAADRAHWPHEYVVESTRLAIAADGRITAIAKGLEPWDALDAGAFACTAEAWEAMDQAPEDCDLSTIFRILAARGRLFAADITGEPWHDIDTATDLAAAELALAAQHSALSARR